MQAEADGISVLQGDGSSLTADNIAIIIGPHHRISMPGLRNIANIFVVAQPVLVPSEGFQISSAGLIGKISIISIMRCSPGTLVWLS